MLLILLSVYWLTFTNAIGVDAVSVVDVVDAADVVGVVDVVDIIVSLSAALYMCNCC